MSIRSSLRIKSRLFHLVTLLIAGIGGLFCSCAAFAQSYNVPFDIKTDAPHPNFTTPLRKHDIFLVGKTIAVDQELRSNGGDVFIFADTVRISAPIDTRVYSMIVGPYYNEADPQKPVDPHSVNQMVGQGIKPFGNFYMWNEYYDAKLRRYRFRSDADKLFNLPGGVPSPIMPSGRVPVSSPMADKDGGYLVDGEDAPKAFDRSAFKSGSIRIVAKHIILCDECTRSEVKFLRPAGGDPFDVESVRFLVSSGIKGGRAGLGSPKPCTYTDDWIVVSPGAPKNPVANKLDCDKFMDSPGAISGLPGKGGDGGDIVIQIIDNDNQYRTELNAALSLKGCADDCDAEKFKKFGSSLFAVSDFSAGNPAHISKLQTPSFNTLSSSESREVFSAISGSTVPVDELRGQPGNFKIQSIRIDEAISAVANELSRADLSAKYDTPSFIKQLYSETQIDSPILRDAISNLLANYLDDRILVVTSALSDELTAKGTAAYPADLLSSFRCTPDAAAGLNGAERQLVSAICAHRLLEQSQGVVRDYFSRSGGLFRPTYGTQVSDGSAEQLTAELQATNANLLKLAEQITNLRGDLYDYMTAEYRAKFDLEVANLLGAIAALKSALENQTAPLNQLIDVLGSAQGDFQRAAASWASADYLAALGPASEGVDNLNRAFSILTSYNDNAATRMKLKKLEIQLNVLRVKYQTFVDARARGKSDLLSLQTSQIRSVFSVLSRSRAIKAKARFAFQDLTRRAIIGYLLDPYRPTELLQIWSTSISSFVTKFPDQEATSFPPVVDWTCVSPGENVFGGLPGRPVSCRTVASENETFQIQTNTASRLPRFPLLIVGAGKGSFQMNGLNLFYNEDISKVTVGGKVRTLGSSAKRP